MSEGKANFEIDDGKETFNADSRDPFQKQGEDMYQAYEKSQLEAVQDDAGGVSQAEGRKAEFELTGEHELSAKQTEVADLLLEDSEDLTLEEMA